MPQAYSMDLRERVAAARNEGHRVQVVADRFGVSTSWVEKLMRKHRETGSLEPSKGTPGPVAKLAAYESELKTLVREHPDATLEELCEKLPVKVSVSTLWTRLQHLDFSYKKSDPCR